MSKITGLGFAVPDVIVRNSEISDSNDWIVKNLGIRERRISTKTTAHLAIMAARKIDLPDIDCVIVATSTPDMTAPSVACIVASALELKCTAFDINAVCSGFIYALTIGDMLIQTGAKNVLVIGADTFSSITDWNNRNCVFFGDGAGAVLLSEGNNFKSFFISTDNEDMYGFHCEKNSTFEMNGKSVYDNATRLLPIAIKEALRIAELNIEDINYMVPHQPSKKILLDTANIVGLSEDRILMNMDRYANTVAATIPILLCESWDKFKKGDKLLFASVGSGWTYGASIYEI